MQEERKYFASAMFLKMDQELVRVLWLSVSFFIIHGSDSTLANMEKSIVSSISDERPDFKLEGYILPGIEYTVFAMSSWIAPYICHTLGARLTLFISAMGYAYKAVAFATENEWVIYSASVVKGVGGGMLWPALARYLVENSPPENVARNSAIFLLFSEGSPIFGNIIMYFLFEGKEYLNQSTRKASMYTLIATNILGLICLATLPKFLSPRTKQKYSFIKTVKNKWHVFVTTRMLWMTLALCYVGLEQAFCEGVYSPSIGFTMAFGTAAKELVALSGICKSVGYIVGSALPMIFSARIRKHRWSRKYIFLFGVIMQLLSFVIIFINLPNNSVFGSTHEISFIHPSVFLTLLVSFLISFADESFSTQTYSFLGEFYREKSAEAFALYKFSKEVFKAGTFYVSSQLGLHIQVAVMAVMSVVGLGAFFMADRDTSATGHGNDKSNDDTYIQTK